MRADFRKRKPGRTRFHPTILPGRDWKRCSRTISHTFFRSCNLSCRFEYVPKASPAIRARRENTEYPGVMQFVLDDVEAHAPIVLHPPRMNDDKFYAFCQRYPNFRIERTAKGEVIIMPPTEEKLPIE